MNEELLKDLVRPFDPSEIKWKPAATSGNKALAIAYVDARVIMDRLDDVLGAFNWSDDYEVLTDGSVICRLRIRVDGEWIVKVDVGSPSEQPDEGDRLKAAFSDSLKRAAVKFGVGRFLYRLPSQWVDYDPVKKRFVGTPKLPASLGQPVQAAKKEPAKAAPSNGTKADGKLLDEINTILTDLRVPGATFRARLKELYQVELASALTQEQAEDLMRRLKENKAYTQVSVPKKTEEAAT